jgi:hypothetical protein
MSTELLTFLAHTDSRNILYNNLAQRLARLPLTRFCALSREFERKRGRSTIDDELAEKMVDVVYEEVIDQEEQPRKKHQQTEEENIFFDHLEQVVRATTFDPTNIQKEEENDGDILKKIQALEAQAGEYHDIDCRCQVCEECEKSGSEDSSDSSSEDSRSESSESNE